MQGHVRSIIVACLFIAFSAAGASAGKRVALVIGNSKYQTVSELTNPANDSEAVAATLRDIGFDDVQLLSDVDHRGLFRALKSFTSLAAGADTAVIYYAGHGVEVDGRNYLVPVDATLVNATDVDFEAVPLENVRTAVSGAVKLRLVILDACRNNPFKLASTGASRSVGRGLAKVEPGANELIAYAAREGTVASDGAGASNSPFAASLIRHLRKPGVEVRLLFGRVRDEVMSTTGKQQEPFVYGSLGGEEIFLNAPPAAATPQTANPDEAGAAWVELADTTDEAVLQRFAAEYANTPFGSLAELRIEELRKQAALNEAAKTAEERAKKAEEELAKQTQQVATLSTTPQTARADQSPAEQDPALLARTLQSELARVGCYSAEIDGEWGRVSSQALERFNQLANLSLAIESPSAEAVRIVQSKVGRVCPLTCQKGFEIRNGACVALSVDPNKSRAKKESAASEVKQPAKTKKKDDKPKRKPATSQTADGSTRQPKKNRFIPDCAKVCEGHSDPHICRSHNARMGLCNP